jgi:uncharacterized protein (TIGR03083 family)
MAERVFVAWVEPITKQLFADAAEVVAFVKAAPSEFWARPSVVDGWLNRDVLAHLAGGNDQMVQTVLRAVVVGEAIDAGVLDPDTDAENEERVRERRSWPIERLLAEFERDGEEMQDLLSKLTDEHSDLRLAGTELTLGKLMRIVEHERHDMLHLEQLRAAVRDSGA